jgi:hypothetical protein
MNDRESRYRQQAQMCRDHAALLSDPQAAETWLKIAAEYDRLADEARELRIVPNGTLQQQPAQQQQQSQTEPEDEK